MRAWRWYRDEEVQRPNKPLQQTKLRRLRVVALVTTMLGGYALQLNGMTPVQYFSHMRACARGSVSEIVAPTRSGIRHYLG